MSYAVYLFRKEVQENHVLSGDDSFFENEENLLPFTGEQKTALTNRLQQYNYVLEAEDNYGLHFHFPKEESISVLLTGSGVYFSASGDGIFEISMTASEFTDSEEFAKYDPQQGDWE